MRTGLKEGFPPNPKRYMKIFGKEFEENLFPNLSSRKWGKVLPQGFGLFLNNTG